MVKVKARFEGDVTVDGGPGLTKAAAIGLVQKYKYKSRDRTTGHNTTYSVNAEVKHENGEGGASPGGVSPAEAVAGEMLSGQTLSGGVSTDRIRQVTTGSSEQTTTIDRTGDFDLTPVYRTIVFTTEVDRIHAAGAAAMASVRWRLNRTVPAAQTTSATPTELRAELNAFVPRGVVGDAPAAVAQQTAQEFSPDHRHVEMPAGAAVESTLPYRKGADVTDELFNRLTSHLAQPDVLGAGGMAQYAAFVGSQLKPSAMEAGFNELTHADGLKLEPMAGRGNGRTTIAVRINAKPVGWVLASEPVPGQSGSVGREQRQSKTSTTGNRLAPGTATGGVNVGILSISPSVGKQVKEQSSDAVGTRLETSAFRNGDLVTVRVPVVYDVTVEQATDKGRGTPETKRTTHLNDAARGEFYVRMLYHEYLEGLRQMEAGGDVSLQDSRLQAIPKKLGKPDLQATEYGEDTSGQRVHQPYRPLLAAIDKAIAEKKTVVLSVQDADGKERLYEAFPDGRLDGGQDGGFAIAFATLNRDLVRWAEGRVDLRELFDTSEPGGNFSTKVAAALEQSGVPTEMLKGLTSSTATRQTAASGSQGAKPAVGAAGRSITPTGNAPALGGP
jgi:hypothetical protein